MPGRVSPSGVSAGFLSNWALMLSLLDLLSYRVCGLFCGLPPLSACVLVNAEVRLSFNLFIHGPRVIHVLLRSVTRGPIEAKNVGRSVGRMWMFDSAW